MHLLVQSCLHLFVHVYIDLEMHFQVQLHVSYQVHTTFYHQAHIKHIYRCSVCTLLCITRCTKNFFHTSIFLIGQILHLFSLLSLFLRTFSSMFQIPCHLQSQLNSRKISMTFFCSFQLYHDLHQYMFHL